MTRMVYEEYRPRAEALAIIAHVISILNDYGRQGLRLTLRQLYYQLVTRNLIANDDREYKRIGDIVSKGRLGGMLDWDIIEDRIRRPETPPEYDSLSELMDVALRSYRLPRLRGQNKYVELWVEKDALAGVLSPIARKYHITLMVNRGYSSTSAMREAGLRVRQACETIYCDRAYVLYLGDLDPSGEDMVRDIDARLSQFLNKGNEVTGFEDGQVDIEENNLEPIALQVQKIALTPEQVETYKPPPNPAKLSDSRSKEYVKRHGYSSWEVDALPPTTLRTIIETAIEGLLDMEQYEAMKQQEERDKIQLRNALDNIRTELG
jgi:hypothetical protein